jgi:hypothetical protein
MINIENYVCTLDQSKKLKELGIEKDSLHSWVHEPRLLYVISNNYEKITDPRVISYPAFTSQELLELILMRIDSKKYAVCGDKIGEPAYYDYTEQYKYFIDTINPNKSEAQERAKFLIYLLEQQKVKNATKNIN